MKRFSVGVLLGVFVLGVGVASAIPVGVSSYNVDNTKLSGYGSWFHTYDGTMTLDGATYDYTGGSGTLNDGVIGPDHRNTHYFDNLDFPAVRVFLDALCTVDVIELYSYVTSTNWIPGNITGVDITIGALTQSFATVGFGPINANGYPAHERVDLTGSPLGALWTDQVIFSNFVVAGRNDFGISEITLDGEIIPEPVTLTLLGSSLIALVFVRRRNRNHKKATLRE